MCFVVDKNNDNKYQWNHFGTDPRTATVDLIIIVDNASLNHVKGLIIADQKYISKDGSYASSLIQPLPEILMYAKTVSHQRKVRVCDSLENLVISKSGMNAILRAIIDPNSADTILKKASVIEKRVCKVIPSPLKLLQSLVLSKPCKPTRTSYIKHKGPGQWVVFIDVVDMLSVLPSLIAKRCVPMYDGYCVISHDIFSEHLEEFFYVYLNQLQNTNGPIAAWVSEMLSESHMDPDYEFFAEWGYVNKIHESYQIKKQKAQDALLYDSAPPACIKQLTERGKSSHWDNKDRYQYAYVIRSVTKALGCNVHDFSMAVVDFMREHKMGEERIREFPCVIQSRNANYADKIPCKTRVQRLNGITCPFGAGIYGVQQCISSRQQKDKNTLDPETVRISDIWTRSTDSISIIKMS